MVSAPELKKVCCFGPAAQLYQTVFSFFSRLFCFTNVTKKYMEKKVYLQLNGSRKIVGILRGYDIFLNVVLDDAVEVRKDGNKTPMGSQTVIRGNSIASLEALETLS